MKNRISIFIILCILSSMIIAGCSKENTDKNSVKTETSAKQESETSKKTSESSKETETTTIEENETTSQDKTTTSEMQTTTVAQEENTTTKVTETTTTKKQEVATTQKQEATTTKKQENTTTKQEEATKEEETTTQAPSVSKTWFEKHGFTYTELNADINYCGSTEAGHNCLDVTMSKTDNGDGTVMYNYSYERPWNYELLTWESGQICVFAVDKYTGICIDYSVEYIGGDLEFESNGKIVKVNYNGGAGSSLVARTITCSSDYDGLILMVVYADPSSKFWQGIERGSKIYTMDEYVDFNTANKVFFSYE